MISTKKITLTALFLALGLILPFFTGQLQQLGNMLLPMHFPVILCGIVCGWQYGLGIGLVLPLLRFALFQMPPIYPVGIAMSFELAVYGAVTGLLYARSKKKIGDIYFALITAMIAGRIVWGVATKVLYTMAANPFTWKFFMAAAVINAIPGIILQLILIPLLIIALQKTGTLPDGLSKKSNL